MCGLGTPHLQIFLVVAVIMLCLRYFLLIKCSICVAAEVQFDLAITVPSVVFQEWFYPIWRFIFRELKCFEVQHGTYSDFCTKVSFRNTRSGHWAGLNCNSAYQSEDDVGSRNFYQWNVPIRLVKWWTERDIIVNAKKFQTSSFTIQLQVCKLQPKEILISHRQPHDPNQATSRVQPCRASSEFHSDVKLSSRIQCRL